MKNNPKTCWVRLDPLDETRVEWTAEPFPPNGTRPFDARSWFVDTFEAFHGWLPGRKPVEVRLERVVRRQKQRKGQRA